MIAYLAGWLSLSLIAAVTAYTGLLVLTARYLHRDPNTWALRWIVPSLWLMATAVVTLYTFWWKGLLTRLPSP